MFNNSYHMVNIIWIICCEPYRKLKLDNEGLRKLSWCPESFEASFEIFKIEYLSLPK